MDIDKKIFKGISFSDLLNDIYLNTRSKNRKIDSVIEEFTGKINTVNDMVVVAPIIREYMDTAVKNDQHLIKLTEIIHKFMVAESKSEAAELDDAATAWELSDGEKQQLIEEMDLALEEAQTTLGKRLPDSGSNAGEV